MGACREPISAEEGLGPARQDKVVVGEQVSVDAQRHLRVGVAEAGSDGADGMAGGQEGRGVGVAQVLKADSFQACLLEKRPKNGVVKVWTIKELARPRAEDGAVDEASGELDL